MRRGYLRGALGASRSDVPALVRWPRRAAAVPPPRLAAQPAGGGRRRRERDGRAGSDNNLKRK